MKKIILVLVVSMLLVGCEEPSIWGFWEYEDRGVRREYRFFHELRENRYETFRDGGRTSGGTFTINGDQLMLTRTWGNFDFDNSGRIRRWTKEEFMESRFALRGRTFDDGRCMFEWQVRNYFPVTTYIKRLRRNTLLLAPADFPSLGRMHRRSRTN